MFRNEHTTAQQVIDKFDELKQQLDTLGDIVLTGEYHREMKLYVEYLSHTLAIEFDLEDIRRPQMTKLNRLQKLKNQGWYKRQKSNKRRERDERER